MAFTLFDEDINLGKNKLLLFKPHPLINTERATLGASLGIPDEGIFVYDKDDKAHYSWNGTAWQSVTGTAYTNEQAQDTIANMFVLGTHVGIIYSYNDPANSISSTIVESDPTVPSWVKSITLLDKSQWTQAYNNSIVNISISGSDTKTITLTQQDGGTLAASFDSLNAIHDEIRFRVGDTGSPVNPGDTSFILTDCSLLTLTNRKIDFYRERDLQYPTDDYIYDGNTGIITVSIPFLIGERIIIKAWNPSVWEVCELTIPNLFNALLINTLDNLLVNPTDNFTI